VGRTLSAVTKNTLGGKGGSSMSRRGRDEYKKEGGLSRRGLRAKVFMSPERRRRLRPARWNSMEPDWGFCDDFATDREQFCT